MRTPQIKRRLPGEGSLRDHTHSTSANDPSTDANRVIDLFARRDLRSISVSERRQLLQARFLPRRRVALALMATEAGVVLSAARQLGDGHELDDADATRLRVAALRILDAQEVLQTGGRS